jgi:hypothetical protein
MTATLEEANAMLKAAVRERLEGTPADDPKMVGYTAEPYSEWVPPAYASSASVAGKTLQSSMMAVRDGVPGEQMTVAEQTLVSALEAVRDRHTKYGPPAEHFGRTAALVNAAFGTTFTAADWALVMVLDKVARLRGPTPTTDGGVDIAGYGGCYEEARKAST